MCLDSLPQPLTGAGGSTPATDVYRLSPQPAQADSIFRLTLLEPYAVHALVGEVKLMAVSHDSTSEAFVLGEHVLLGTRAAASTVKLAGSDVLSQLAGTATVKFSMIELPLMPFEFR